MKVRFATLIPMVNRWLNQMFLDSSLLLKKRLNKL